MVNQNYVSKYTTDNLKRQTHKLQENIANQYCDKGLMSRI